MSDAPGARRDAPDMRDAASSALDAAPKAVVAGHGALAAGLVSAVEQITGQGERFVTLSNASLSGEQVEQVLRAALASSGASIVFTDLPAGSWTLAARRVHRDTPHVVIATGVNLAMLLDFLFQAGDPNTTAAAVVEKGRAAIGSTPASAPQAQNAATTNVASSAPAAPKAPQSAASASSATSATARSAESADGD